METYKDIRNLRCNKFKPLHRRKYERMRFINFCLVIVVFILTFSFVTGLMNRDKEIARLKQSNESLKREVNIFYDDHKARLIWKAYREADDSMKNKVDWILLKKK